MKIIASNKKAFYELKSIREFTAGIVLLGPEVKSIRLGQISLLESFIKVIGEKNEAFWINGQIRSYANADLKFKQSYDLRRSRKLLLKKSELRELYKLLNQKGATALPSALVESGNHFKLKFVVGLGKSKVDKRHSIRERDLNRETLKFDKLKIKK